MAIHVCFNCEISGGIGMRSALVLLLSLCVTACGKTTLIDESGMTYFGQYNSISKELSFDVSGKFYQGFYIVNASTSTMFLSRPGPRPQFASAQIHNPGNAGQAILRAYDGSTLRCEFQYQGMNAIGSCVDLAGKTYQLTAGM